MPDIFISYKREDHAEAGKLAAALKSVGWDVWWDPELRAGEHFDKVIEQALEECRCVVVLWSPLSIASQYVRDEASFALKRNKLVPLRSGAVEPPFRFQGLHTLDFTDWNGSAAAPVFQELVEDVRSRIGAPGEPKPVTTGQARAGAPSARSSRPIALAGGAALLIAAILGGLGWWKFGGGGRPDCLLSIEIEAVGHRADVRSLELLAGGTRRPFPVSGRKTTIEIPAAHLNEWKIRIVWDAGDPSPVSGLRGCKDWHERISDDGKARVSISRS